MKHTTIKRFFWVFRWCLIFAAVTAAYAKDPWLTDGRSFTKLESQRGIDRAAQIMYPRIVVYFDRRSHNPVLREAELDRDCPKIPWIGNHRLEFVYT